MKLPATQVTMTVPQWKSLAETKRQSILDAIPAKWRFQDPVPEPAELRDVTGPYIQQFLTPREVEITETDAVGVAEKTTSGQWSAVEVTEAFCHRAALAHQLVCFARRHFRSSIGARGNG